MKRIIFILSIIIIVFSLTVIGKEKMVVEQNDYNRTNISHLKFPQFDHELLNNTEVLKQNKVAFGYCLSTQKPKRYFSNSNNDTLTKVFYDSLGRMIERFGLLIEKDWVINYSYDSLGLPESECYTMWSNTIDLTTRYFYNKKARKLLQTWSKNIEDTVHKKIVREVVDTCIYIFDEEGYLTSSVVYDVWSQFNYKGHYYYDWAHKLVIEEREYFSSNDGLKISSEYYYTGSRLDSTIVRRNCNNCGEDMLLYDSKTYFDKSGLRISSSEMHDSARFVFGYRKFE